MIGADKREKRSCGLDQCCLSNDLARLIIPLLFSEKAPPYKPDKPHDGDNGDEITGPVKRTGGEAEFVYIAELGFTGWAFRGLQRQMGIALGAFFGHKAVTAGARAIGHFSFPFTGCLEVILEVVSRSHLETTYRPSMNS